MFRGAFAQARRGFSSSSFQNTTGPRSAVATALRGVGRPTANLGTSLEQLYMCDNAFSYSGSRVAGAATGTNATNAARTAAVNGTMGAKKAAQTASSTLATPAQASAAGGLIFIPMGFLIGLTMICTKLGVAEWTLYRYFETNIIEKGLCKKMSTMGRKESIARNTSKQSADEYAAKWHELKTRRSIAHAKAHNDVEWEGTRHI